MAFLGKERGDHDEFSFCFIKLLNCRSHHHLIAMGGARKDETMEDITSLLILLFLFSQVSERLGNFIKLHIVDRFIPNVPNDPYLEKKKERRTILTSLVAAGIIAVSFELYDKDNLPTGIDKMFTNDALSITIRIIIISFLLAFGSKFWHDLLDLVFYYKKIKQIAAGGQGNSSFAENEAVEDREISKQEIDELIDEKFERWKYEYPNIVTVTSGYKVVDGKPTDSLSIIFEVKVKDQTIDDVDKIPKYVKYRGKHIPTDVQVVNVAKIQRYSKPDPESLIKGAEFDPRRPGSGISRKDSSNFGTISLKVYREIKGKVEGYYVLGCYHVLCQPEFLNKRFYLPDGKKILNPEVICPCKLDGGHKLKDRLKAVVVEGRFDKYIDAAIAKLENDFNLTEKVHGLDGPKGIYDVKEEDIGNLEVFTWGRSSGKQSGKVIKKSINFPAEILSGEPLHMFNSLIRVSQISVEGDSGAPVFTKDGNVIGIIVAGDEVEYSYVLPIRRILNGLSVKICTY